MNNAQDFFYYLKKINILYVEDDANTREELEFFLQKKVNKLIVAQNGQEGIEFFKENNVDLVITDIQMPVMDGIKMVKAIREINPNIPIIITTAFSDSEHLFEAIKLNVTNYLTKPLNLYDLRDSLLKISKNIHLEKENKEIYNRLKQYKDIVDERSIISKATVDGIITYVNKPFEEIYGYSKDEIIGKSHNIITHTSNDKMIFKELWDRVKIEKKSWQGRIKNMTKDGFTRYVDLIIKPILDLDGNILEFISLANDITDLETTMEYFKNQTQKSTYNLNESIRVINTYKEVIDDSNIILRMNLNRDITYVNSAFLNISGYSNDELIGKSYSLLKHYNLSSQEANKKIDEIFSKDIWKGKISNYSKNGEVFHCNVTMYPLKDENGEVIEFMEIRHDITKIENLYDELEETQREIVYKLGEIGETRSSETGFHVKRVAEYSKLFAEKLNLSKKDTKLLFMASPMHDIGKVGIPDNILNKPGKLTPQEWEIMKTHAQIGYEILKNSKRDILKSAAIVSYNHHERWDGTGYPRGLSGEDIHIFGRITAIADVFDALGSDRCYKKAYLLEDILELFRKERGKHFDPKLVDIFMDNLPEFLEIRDRLKETDIEE